MPARATIRMCVMCKHLAFSLGERAYSNETPGGPGYIACDKTQAFSLGESATDGDFRKAMRTAETCEQFDPVLFDDIGRTIDESLGLAHRIDMRMGAYRILQTGPKARRPGETGMATMFNLLEDKTTLCTCVFNDGQQEDIILDSSIVYLNGRRIDMLDRALSEYAIGCITVITGPL